MVPHSQIEIVSYKLTLSVTVRSQKCIKSERKEVKKKDHEIENLRVGERQRQ